MIVLILYATKTRVEKVFIFTDEDLAAEHQLAYIRQERQAQLLTPTEVPPVPLPIPLFDLEGVTS